MTACSQYGHPRLSDRVPFPSRMHLPSEGSIGRHADRLFM
ncbi:hypothetical protein DESPIG_01464 [Desulfovibrio piger ATCC 29098]|uniref:Uncharacterized protein n=1 Tax=Desulfovibrio piger ATCC 29098 TaxID=411464 RepID=B6WTQ7_9BACT|nr:hypothetical protein DESPIG_01464 [Desulfovibrio piger ATCC 29098]